MIKRCFTTMAMLTVTASCVPQHRGARVVVAVPPATRLPVADHRLLRQLALTDPLDSPAPLAVAAQPSFAAPPPFEIGNVANDDAQRALQCLTAAVYYEARSEPLDGQRAVAQVVLNRVRDRAFPNSVCKVVYQHPAHAPGCQFSFACDGSMTHPLDPRAWSVAGSVARAALSGSVYAPVGSATYYHTTAVQPWWAASLTRIGLVGSHIFYRWGNALGRALSFRQAYSGDETLPTRLLAASSPVAATPSGNAVGVGTGDDRVQGGVMVHRATIRPAAAAPALVQTTFGVTVHYGIHDTGGGKTVHIADGGEVEATPAT